MSAARAKGTGWESAIVSFLKDMGRPYVERRSLNGAKDRGDIAGIPGVVIEAKCAKALTFGPWLNEAHLERENDKAEVGVVWAKRRGKASAADGFVVMDGKTFAALLTAAGY